MKAVNHATGMIGGAVLLGLVLGTAPAWAQATSGQATSGQATPDQPAVAGPPAAAAAVAVPGSSSSPQGAAAVTVTQTPSGTAVSAAGAASIPGVTAQTIENIANIAMMGFEQTTEAFTVVKDTAAYVAPYAQAPQMYPIPAGIGVQATAESKDKTWIVAVTEDGQAAYLPVADLGPYQASAETSVPSLPDTMSGPATVIDTSTLMINNQQVPLFGLLGETGILADRLQDIVGARGMRLTCVLRGQSYVCVMPDGQDLGRLILFNGAARPGPDATDDYQKQAAAAQVAHKGVWK